MKKTARPWGGGPAAVALLVTAALHLTLGLGPAWGSALLAAAGLGLLVWRPSGEGAVMRDGRLERALEELCDMGFVALPDVSLGHTVMEWVVIGPPGVFVVASERRRARRLGRREPRGAAGETTAESARRRAERLADRLGILVDPLVVDLGDPGLPAVAGVPVIPVDHLVGWLGNRRARWTAARVETVHRTLLEIVGGAVPTRRSA